MDAYRRGDEFIVHLDLPGVDPGSIDITVESGMLTVSAERRFEQKDEDEVFVNERPQGRFQRELRLGSAIDVENIGASYEGGVLSLTLPVSERAKPRTIQVQARDKDQSEIEPGS